MKPGKKGRTQAGRVPPAEEIRRLAGAIGDDTIAAILASGASFEDVEIAVAYIQGQANELDRRGHHLEGRVARVYDVLAGDPLYANYDDER